MNIIFCMHTHTHTHRITKNILIDRKNLYLYIWKKIIETIENTKRNIYGFLWHFSFFSSIFTPPHNTSVDCSFFLYILCFSYHHKPMMMMMMIVIIIIMMEANERFIRLNTFHFSGSCYHHRFRWYKCLSTGIRVNLFFLFFSFSSSFWLYLTGLVCYFFFLEFFVLFCWWW